MAPNGHNYLRFLLCAETRWSRPAEDMVMKRLLVGSVALVALSTAAFAVEIGPAFEALPPQEPTPYNWTGTYGRTNTLTPNDSLMFGYPTTGAPEGFNGTAQFGYNYQMGPMVLGI